MAVEAGSVAAAPRLEKIDPAHPPSFRTPTKEIHNGDDVSTFLGTRAYKDTMTFLLQLNRAVVPSKVSPEEDGGSERPQPWALSTDAVEFSEPVRRLQLLLERVESIIDEVPPDPGPRRFGNISFRKWCQVLEERAEQLLAECVSSEALQLRGSDSGSAPAVTELVAYLLGGFGSAQRLDYGTGHELSFLAFLAGLWKLGGFAVAEVGVEERGIVLGVIEPYLNLVRRLITTYTLEPAGSHGVWGLDDHSFIPYIFGSAQFCPAISASDNTPVEGSLPNTPEPGEVAKASSVARERKTNMYFSAIGFIHDVKRGPFWEHSPMLYDISGIRDGWGKINKGMIKMYNAEVLSKFPVVQHFPFGALFSWEAHPDLARQSSVSAGKPGLSGHAVTSTAVPPGPGAGTKAPWATKAGSATSVPGSARGMGQTARRPGPPPPPTFNGTTRAPWATTSRPVQTQQETIPTRAPWAEKRPSG